jgi:hypothetical protein
MSVRSSVPVSHLNLPSKCSIVVWWLYYLGAILERKIAREARLTQPSDRPPAFVGYSLQLKHPDSGQMRYETYSSMPAVVTRAARLIKSGYHIAILASANRSSAERQNWSERLLFAEAPREVNRLLDCLLDSHI